MHLTQALHTAVQQAPGRPLTSFGDRVRSVAESAARVGRLAAGLRALGVARGDRVALLGGNSDRFHAALPTSAAGKVLKRTLRDERRVP
ncbi:MAG TPA: AMP-binding protein [Dactylosporangium sp.]|jgi:acyl-CoA synthetase (AMP-forming)/AMP-acid ligase II|nr:AMP-binding protein [Dactylosporangium sp.]